MRYRFHTIFRPEPEGGFTAIVPSLPGCVTFGKNLIEAQKMVKEAISAYVASLKKHREAIPTDEDIFSADIEVSAVPERSYAA